METLLQQLTHGKALLLIIILGIGGSFHNGYHATELSSPSPYIQRFINSSWYDRYEEHPPPQTITMMWSLIVSMFAVGGLLGALSVRFVTGMLGRKKAMICNSLIAIVAAGIMLASKGAKSYEMIIVARFLYGFSAGLGRSIHVMYLGEISPRKLRGTVMMTSTTFTSIGKLSGQVFGLRFMSWLYSPLNVLSSVTLTSMAFISLGKLSGQFFGLSEILGREELWHILLCVPAFLFVVQIIVLPFLPEAPRYLFIEKGDEKACKKALQSLWGKGDYKEEMDEMLVEQAATEAAPPKSPLQLLRDKSVRWQLMSLSIICFCNNLSGMSAISIFSFDIFLKAGIPRDKIRYVTLGLGVTEIVTSIACGLLIERTGRRRLVWGGYGVMFASWVFVTVSLNLRDSSDWVSYVIAGLIILFILSFSGGPGGAIDALNSELFIQSDRIAAFVIIGIERWVLFIVLGLVFPFLINALNSYCFVLFAVMCLLGCLYTFFLLPETKGKTLLEISEEFKAISVCGKSFFEEKKMETKL